MKNLPDRLASMFNRATLLETNNNIHLKNDALEEEISFNYSMGFLVSNVSFRGCKNISIGIVGSLDERHIATE